MSKKYMVVTDIDGEEKILCLTANVPQSSVEPLCRKLAEKLFAGHTVGDIYIEPWPLSAAEESGASTL